MYTSKVLSIEKNSFLEKIRQTGTDFIDFIFSYFRDNVVYFFR
jgi:hypothetical protein